MYRKSTLSLRNQSRIKNYKKYFIKDYFLKIEKMIKGNNLKILDIGCASCNFEYYFVNKNKNRKFEFHSIDNDENLIKIAKRKISDKRVIIRKKSIKNYYIKETYDYILIMSTICLWKNPFRIIAKIKKNLNKNGKIIIFDAFNKNNLNITIKTTPTKKRGKSITTYFFSKDYFIKKIKSIGYLKYKFIPIKFDNFKKKRKTIWNESYAVKINNTIKYLRSDNYLLDQSILMINKS